MGNEITKCNQTRVKRQPRVQKHRQVNGTPSSKPKPSKKPPAQGACRCSDRLSRHVDTRLVGRSGFRQTAENHSSMPPKLSKKPQAPKLPSKPKPPPDPPPTESQSTSPSPEEISSTYEILD